MLRLPCARVYIHTQLAHTDTAKSCTLRKTRHTPHHPKKKNLPLPRPAGDIRRPPVSCTGPTAPPRQIRPRPPPKQFINIGPRECDRACRNASTDLYARPNETPPATQNPSHTRTHTHIGPRKRRRQSVQPVRPRARTLRCSSPGPAGRGSIQSSARADPRPIQYGMSGVRDPQRGQSGRVQSRWGQSQGIRSAGEYIPPGLLPAAALGQSVLRHGLFLIP